MPEMTPEQLPYSALCALSKAELEKQPCRCVNCVTCGGSGTLRYDASAWYFGKRGSDDWEEAVPCDDCRRGISETCDRCGLLTEMDREEEGSRL